jgi:CheY-like chemotaxis protein
MTANALQGDRERCILAGMDDYVAKPIHSDDLQAVLSRWLPRAEAVAQGSSDTVEIQRRF